MLIIYYLFLFIYFQLNPIHQMQYKTITKEVHVQAYLSGEGDRLELHKQKNWSYWQIVHA